MGTPVKNVIGQGDEVFGLERRGHLKALQSRLTSIVATEACQKINPDNPGAVAESIEKMYEALKLYQSHQVGKRGHFCWECAEAIKQALAKAEGKEEK